MNKYLELFSLIVGLSAILTILFYLITAYNLSIYFLEPMWFIRIPEIIIGIFTIFFLLIMIKQKTSQIILGGNQNK